MEQIDFRKFCTAMEEHGIAFKYKLDPGQLEIYFDKLKKWPMGDIEKAMDACFYTCHHFPTIHDIAIAYHHSHPVL